MMEQRARWGFLGCDWYGNCDDPVPCRVRPVTTPVPRVTRGRSQVKPSLHDFADALAKTRIHAAALAAEEQLVLVGLQSGEARAVFTSLTNNPHGAPIILRQSGSP